MSATNKQLDAARDEALEEAALLVEEVVSWGLTPSRQAAVKLFQLHAAKVIRALKVAGE